tara:strand:+ start:68 stop:937 length:870 start_codon:yes stop_codon:yes gene_type:complete
MSSGNILEKVKRLREITGVGFKDCKIAIEESKGDVEKAVEYLRKKGIAKAGKRMQRTAADGLISISEEKNKFSIIEINSETDFVAKNSEFIKFVEEVSQLTLSNLGKMEDLLNSKMKNGINVKDNLVSLISKIGEKITIRRTDFIDSGKYLNFSYTHSSIKKNIGKIGVLLSLESKIKNKDILELGKKLAMHVAALSPLSIDREDLDKKILNKEKEIITEELKNSGKDSKIVDKIANGKLNKFIDENTLLNQQWIMEPKNKVKDILKGIAGKEEIKIKKFTRFKVGEGI